MDPYWEHIARELLAEVGELKFHSDPEGAARWVGRATATLKAVLQLMEPADWVGELEIPGA